MALAAMVSLTNSGGGNVGPRHHPVVVVVVDGVCIDNCRTAGNKKRAADGTINNQPLCKVEEDHAS